MADGSNEIEKTRALLTETDREYITGAAGDKRKYESVARVRARVREELPRDLDLLEEHHSKLLEEIIAEVCERSP